LVLLSAVVAPLIPLTNILLPPFLNVSRGRFY